MSINDVTFSDKSQEITLVDTDTQIGAGMHMMMQSTLTPKQWVLEGLIERGDQVLIAGAPKTGKSLLASQLALAVASGGQFLRWKSAAKMQVAYVNLEIRRRSFAERICAQIGGWQNSANYANLIAIDDMMTINILDVDQRDILKKRIARADPALVIFDVLARCHVEDEQSQAMKAVMLALRVCAGGAASIVVHHTRKSAAGMDGVSQQASDIRGSSAIHGEVDTAMVLTKRAGQGARFAMTFSARSVEVPDEVLLDRGSDLLMVEASMGENARLKDVLQQVYRTTDVVLASELSAHLCDAFLIAERRARDYIKLGVENGYICRRHRSDKKYEYYVPEKSAILRSVKP